MAEPEQTPTDDDGDHYATRRDLSDLEKRIGKRMDNLRADINRDIQHALDSSSERTLRTAAVRMDAMGERLTKRMDAMGETLARIADKLGVENGTVEPDEVE
ncbi:MAG: hypothetical protein OXH15_16580 [Gammaproteobacteria bacterium]|nr:hypothetical protein [Gammaproteobacteria bacterium]